MTTERMEVGQQSETKMTERTKRGNGQWCSCTECIGEILP